MSVLLTGSLGLCKVKAFCHSCFADMRAGKSFNGFRPVQPKADILGPRPGTQMSHGRFRFGGYLKKTW